MCVCLGEGMVAGCSCAVVSTLNLLRDTKRRNKSIAATTI